MHEILIVADVLGLPQECNFFKRLQLDAVARHSFGEYVEYLIAMLLVLEGEVIGFLGDDLEADIAQLVPPFEQLTYLLDFNLVH